MVVLEAAAIGAASYGLYKGGEAGFQKGKECRKEIQRERKRSSQRSALGEKTKSRSERIAEIVQMKTNGVAGNTTGGAGLSRFGFGSAATTPSFVERQLADKEANADIDERHRNVMQKLRSGRAQERMKGGSDGKRRFNPFKKK